MQKMTRRQRHYEVVFGIKMLLLILLLAAVAAVSYYVDVSVTNTGEICVKAFGRVFRGDLTFLNSIRASNP